MKWFFLVTFYVSVLLPDRMPIPGRCDSLSAVPETRLSMIDVRAFTIPFLWARSGDSLLVRQSVVGLEGTRQPFRLTLGGTNSPPFNWIIYAVTCDLAGNWTKCKGPILVKFY